RELAVEPAVDDLADGEAGDDHARLVDEAGGVVEAGPEPVAARARSLLGDRLERHVGEDRHDEDEEADLDGRREALHGSTASAAQWAGGTADVAMKRRTYSLSVCLISSTVPSATMRPAWIIAMRSAMRNTDAMSWVTTIEVTLNFSAAVVIMRSAFSVASGSR